MPHEIPDKHDLRFVEVRGVRYLRAEDVKKYLLALAATEETDVRNRLTAAAENLGKVNQAESDFDTVLRQAKKSMQAIRESPGEVTRIVQEGNRSYAVKDPA